MLPINWTILEVFLACQTQWRQAPNGLLTGIDYQAAAAVVGLMEVPQEDRRVTFDGVRLMEHAALQELERGRNTKSKPHPQGRR